MSVLRINGTQRKRRVLRVAGGGEGEAISGPMLRCQLDDGSEAESKGQDLS